MQFFAKLCRAAGFAHVNHVVHRDIKPQNVLVSDEGAPLLTDFGVCRFQDADQNAEAQRQTETIE
ncbi:MAG TPA: hypothetical protein ENO16_07905, partial [Chromatiales bacterium]|nr:hypothetical protein [Chromatiales bacterium]